MTQDTLRVLREQLWLNRKSVIKTDGLSGCRLAPLIATSRLLSFAVPWCEGCFALVAELAEAERRGDAISEALKPVRVHFSQCPCCVYEYATLLEALSAADDSVGPESGT